VTELQRDFVRPSLFDHYYVEGVGRVRALKRISEREFKDKTASFSKGKPGLLLDLGGKESPYEEVTQGLPVRWISVDMKKYTRTQVILDAQGLPFRDGAFDAVLCTQVLGYVPNFIYCR
jgi:hypothetical protein